MLNSIGFSEAFEYMLMNFLKEPFKKPFPSYTTMIESYSPGIKGCGLNLTCVQPQSLSALYMTSGDLPAFLYLKAYLFVSFSRYSPKSCSFSTKAIEFLALVASFAAPCLEG